MPARLSPTNQITEEFFMLIQQNPEPAVTFDTVANVKKQHEINVGKSLTSNERPTRRVNGS